MSTTTVVSSPRPAADAGRCETARGRTQTSASGPCRAAAAPSTEPTTDPDPTPAPRAKRSNDSPLLLHKIESARPRDRNRNNARHPSQQLTDNDTVSPIGAERTESALTAGARPP